MEMDKKTAKPRKKIEWLKRENVVLSPELKEVIEKEVVKAVDFGNKLFKTDLPYPDVRWDLKSRVGAIANYGLNRLRFHPIFASENPTDYRVQTVWHEVAHLFTRHLHRNSQKKIMSHGAEWREIMVKFKRGPKEGKGWDTVIKHVYNPASLALPERKKTGPRKAGGKKVGEIIAKIKSLKPEELEALKGRLGFEVSLAGEKPREPTKEEIQAGAEHYKLHKFLVEEHISDRPDHVVSTSGWAHAVIKQLKKGK